MKILTPVIDHTNRQDNFRYENDFNTESEAFDNARERSLKTVKTIYVMTDGKKFQTNVHGIIFIGWKVFARFQKGLKLD